MNNRHDRLKALTRLIVKKAGNLDVASAATGIAMSTLSSAQRGEKDKRCNWLTLAEVDALEQFVGEPVVTGRLAAEYEEAPHMAVRSTSITASNLMTFANAEAKEKLERDQAVEHALQDNVVSDAELDRLIAEQEDVMRAAEKHHQWLCSKRTARRQRAAGVTPIRPGDAAE